MLEGLPGKKKDTVPTREDLKNLFKKIIRLNEKVKNREISKDEFQFSIRRVYKEVEKIVPIIKENEK